ncbi:MAG: hypothetical protein HY240_03055 [Actinobacteria bacterium]|nr:hypothetical protein [Actinomycetota bacterium]
MPRGVRAALLLAWTAICLLWAGIAAAQSPAPGAADRAAADQVVLSGRVVVPRGQAVGEVMVFHGRVQVAGVAQQDVVVLEGSVVVTGQVAGSVIAVDGDVTLGPAAQVGGDVLAGGEVSVAGGARVGGSVRAGVRFTLHGQLGAVGSLVSWLAATTSTLLLGMLLLWIAPRGADRVASAARTAPWKSAIWGLVTAAAVPAVAVALLASVLGLPLGLALLLGLGLLAFVGYTWAALIIGRALVKEAARPLAFLAGWAVLRAVGLIPVVSGVTFALAAVGGVGAMTVATWRARGRSREPARGGRHRARRATPSEDVVLEEEASRGLS